MEYPNFQQTIDELSYIMSKDEIFAKHLANGRFQFLYENLVEILRMNANFAQTL